MADEAKADETPARIEPEPVVRRARKRSTSRPARWAEACEKARAALDEALAALEDLRSVQEEYEEWRDGLPENLQSSPVGEKLEAVCDIDIESAKSSVEEAIGAIDEAEGADLPRGFGKD